MLLIDEYMIKRVDKGDIIVRGNPLEISKHRYEDGWQVVGNLRDRDELEVEKTGILTSLADFLGSAHTFGQQYDGTSLVGKNNPLFVNYPLPDPNFKTQASVDSYDFHLQASSPAAGKGYLTFTPISNVPIDPNFGSSGIMAPCKDIGCYQLDGSGNQH